MFAWILLNWIALKKGNTLAMHLIHIHTGKLHVGFASRDFCLVVNIHCFTKFGTRMDPATSRANTSFIFFLSEIVLCKWGSFFGHVTCKSERPRGEVRKTWRRCFYKPVNSRRFIKSRKWQLVIFLFGVPGKTFPTFQIVERCRYKNFFALLKLYKNLVTTKIKTVRFDRWLIEWIGD